MNVSLSFSNHNTDWLYLLSHFYTVVLIRPCAIISFNRLLVYHFVPLNSNNHSLHPCHKTFSPCSDVSYNLTSPLASSDGRLLLGASSLTSRYWTGDVWLFDKASDAPDISRFTAAREAESGVPCGMFIDGLGVRAVVCQVRSGEQWQHRSRWGERGT